MISTKQLHRTRLLVLGLSSVMLASCINKEEPMLEKRIRPVRTMLVAETPQDMIRSFAGGSQAAISSNLSFRTAGQITELPVKVGQEVVAGQLIARLNDSDLKIKLERDEAAYRQAKVQADNTRSQYSRMQNLFDRKLVSRVEFDNAQANYQAAQAQMDQAEGSVELSQKQLSYTRLNSPGAGCSVSEVHAEVNENVSIGQAVATINCGSSIEVVVGVPESLIGAISIGSEVDVKFPSLKERTFVALTTEIGTASSSNSAYPVTVRMSNDEHVLRPGMAAEVHFRINLSAHTENLWVPLVAVGAEGAERFVYLYETEGAAQGVVRRRVIKTGNFTLEEVEVLEGLDKGDRVITAGLSQIYDGLTVKLLDEAKKNL